MEIVHLIGRINTKNSISLSPSKVDDGRTLITRLVRRSRLALVGRASFSPSIRNFGSDTGVMWQPTWASSTRGHRSVHPDEPVHPRFPIRSTTGMVGVQGGWSSKSNWIAVLLKIVDSSYRSILHSITLYWRKPTLWRTCGLSFYCLLSIRTIESYIIDLMCFFWVTF